MTLGYDAGKAKGSEKSLDQKQSEGAAGGGGAEDGRSHDADAVGSHFWDMMSVLMDYLWEPEQVMSLHFGIHFGIQNILTRMTFAAASRTY